MNPSTLLLFIIAGLVIADCLLTYVKYKAVSDELTDLRGKFSTLERRCASLWEMAEDNRARCVGLRKSFGETRDLCDYLDGDVALLKVAVTKKISFEEASRIKESTVPSPKTIVVSHEDSKKKKKQKNK